MKISNNNLRKLARDTLRGYLEKRLNRDEYVLTGEVPAARKQVMVAWYRVDCEGADNIKPFSINKIEVLQ